MGLAAEKDERHGDLTGSSTLTAPWGCPPSLCLHLLRVCQVAWERVVLRRHQHLYFLVAWSSLRLPHSTHFTSCLDLCLWTSAPFRIASLPRCGFKSVLINHPSSHGGEMSVIPSLPPLQSEGGKSRYLYYLSNCFCVSGFGYICFLPGLHFL